MPFRRGKMSGVLNDSNSNELSYVDMHDLHPENVQAAQVQGAVSGAMSGATLASIPAALVSFGIEQKPLENAVEHQFTLKNWRLGAAIIGVGAVIMGAVRAYTATKDAETHNAWSEKVLARMEAREAAEAKQREQGTPPAQPSR